MRAPPPDAALGVALLASDFEVWLKRWRSGGFALIAEAWTGRAYGLGQACRARLPTEMIEGMAEGLDADGALRLRSPMDRCVGSRPGTCSSESPGLMLLAIEQGNTNTLFAVHDGDRWIAQWRAATEARRTADEYAVWLSQLLAMAGLSLGGLDACIVSSVVPQSVFNLRNLARRYLHVEPMIVGENVDLGIAVRIQKPSEAGADRLVNAIGAHAAYPGALLIIDCGTATTFDIVGDDGGFEGGAIAPGINLSVEALHAAAARLPRIAIRRPGAVDRRRHGRGDAVGRFLGLCRDDRGLGGADESRIPRAADRGRHRRRRLSVRGRDRRDRPVRPRPHLAWDAGDRAAQPGFRPDDSPGQTTNSSSCRSAARTRSA